MKRNKYFEREKAIIRIENERNEIWQAIRNQAWIELDVPILNGWYGEWVLRDDISRSTEAETLNYIISRWGSDCWSRRKDFKEKNWRTRGWTDILPHFSSIDEKTYDGLSAKVKRYFVLDTRDEYKAWWRPTYKVDIDGWKLEVKLTRAYTTHYREHDEVLYQMESENEFELYNTNPYPYHRYRSAGWWRKIERKKAKRKQQAEDRDIVKSYNLGMEYEDYNVPTDKTVAMDWYW